MVATRIRGKEVFSGVPEGGPALTPEPPLSTDPTAETLPLEVADARYAAQDWAAASMLYRMLMGRDPAAARARGVPLALGHCLIELQDGADPGALARELTPDAPYEAKVARAFGMRARAIALCRAGDHARARRLLRFMAAFDLSIGMVYLESFMKGRSGIWETVPDGAAARPGFLARDDWSDDAIAALKARFAGRRILMILPWLYPFGPGEMYPRTARAFGLDPVVIDRNAFFAEHATVAARLAAAIAEHRPDMLLFNSFLELPVAAPEQDLMLAAMTPVLEAARARGMRVVANFFDAWYVAPERVPLGLGSALDLVHHVHPALTLNPELQDPRIWCYFHPLQVAPTDVAPGSIPRACAAGGINFANAGRVVWWAETANAGLPLDYRETAHQGRLSPEEYAGLMRSHQITVNLTRRTTGVKIATGRSIETLAAGGVLLEEDSFDTRYFLKPGEHYVPFETWADLTELVPKLLADAAWRARLARAGQPWVARHFAGDWYWAGLLSRLYPGAG